VPGATRCANGQKQICDAAGNWQDTTSPPVQLLLNPGFDAGHVAWTQTTLQELWEAIIGQPDEGDRNFEEKLRDQLSPLSDDAHRVAAEAVGFFYLFSSKVRAKTKLEKVQEIISWRVKDSTANLRVLDEAFAVAATLQA
jgi:hypothetical protein